MVDNDLQGTSPIDWNIPDLGINAQPLRFMDFLADNVIRLNFGDLKVSVPHPANFALLKVIISARRQKPVKKTNDLRQAVQVMRALIEADNGTLLKNRFDSCPAKWKKTIINTLQAEPLAEEIIAVLK